MGDGEEPQSEDGLVRVTIQARGGAIAEAVRRLDEAQVGIEDIAVRRPTLDDVFLTLTGRTAENAEEEEQAEAA
jgi:ABC-2 type transport system ATP-binding protein